MPPVLAILCSVVIGVVGQLIFKSAMTRVGPLGLRNRQFVQVAFAIAGTPAVWAGLGLYGLSMVFWLVALSRVELGYAYPFLSLSYPLILLSSWALLNETIGRLRLVGVAAICLGVYMVAAA